MKVTKSQLKNILKECLSELINEGAFTEAIKESLGTNNRVAANDILQSNSVPQQSQETESFAAVGQMTPNDRLRQLSKQTAAAAAHGDPKKASMLEHIFSDTASTTLQEQVGAEGPGGGGLYAGVSTNSSEASQQVEKSDIQALSSEHGMSHWAKLAFGAYEKQ